MPSQINSAPPDRRRAILRRQRHIPNLPTIGFRHLENRLKNRDLDDRRFWKRLYYGPSPNVDKTRVFRTGRPLIKRCVHEIALAGEGRGGGDAAPGLVAFPHPPSELRSSRTLPRKSGRGRSKRGCRIAPALVPTPPMAEKPKKPQKLRARLPRGLADRGPAEIAATRRMTETIREVFERYGFEPVETPAMEFTDALGKFLPDQDRPNEGVFSFQDDDEQWISLRYDLTAPLARYVAENFDALPKPYRSYRAGYVYRNEKPGPGRFRQFMQFDADTVGSASPAADAEMCMMAADAMEALGIPRGSYVVKVNNRKVLDGVRDAIGIADDGHWLTVMRAIDKLDRLGISGVQQLLGDGRKDESGDFTKGAGLSRADIVLITGIIEPVEEDAQIDIRLR